MTAHSNAQWPLRERRVPTHDGRTLSSGDFEDADRAHALLAEDPSYGASGNYQTACFKSLAGRTDVALAHLRRAVELEPSNAQIARDGQGPARFPRDRLRLTTRISR
jgi:hypothetical protein